MRVKEFVDNLNELYQPDDEIIAFWYDKSHFDDLGIDISSEQWRSIAQESEDVNLGNVVEQIEEIIESET